MVPEVGLEPTRREAGDFESPMYTNFITQAKTCKLYLALQKNLLYANIFAKLTTQLINLCCHNWVLAIIPLHLIIASTLPIISIKNTQLLKSHS